ncbi:hypothetical protein [Plebeiibacterium sediminum]|uniref:Uncharacterized protein n=1 Tax=Plebeiibacterium sediminum TaxID=2992112 RepID=A0AAE3SIQ3_9BACT|nr:hypothetical protein [Plebeiobacterium sediminum]MCW3789468.1 hypothetical protein [Plebeiobacterium sediminum]
MRVEATPEIKRKMLSDMKRGYFLTEDYKQFQSKHGQDFEELMKSVTSEDKPKSKEDADTNK